MAADSGHPPAALAIVIPTLNERENVPELLSRLERALPAAAWEAVFVDDDSDDGTAELVRSIARRDPRVRCIQRIGRRGLSSAAIEGILATSAPYVAVMDADLQHDEALLPEMLRRLEAGEADLVVGSRLIAGGSTGTLSGWRRRISEIGSGTARSLLALPVRDLMSGFFMLRREVFEACAHQLSGVGFKILLDILASAPPGTLCVELPYRFRARHAGSSKLDSNAAVALLMTLIDKKFGRVLPPRLVAFLLVGSFGVLVHFAALALALKVAGWSFLLGQTAATFIAMTSNFAINNELTYRDVRLRGWKWVRGWLSFTVICSFGAIANIGVANALFVEEFSWRLSALAGVLIGTAWNYGVTRYYTWQFK